jgi:DNA-binding MarR family transcriptional regulator
VPVQERVYTLTMSACYCDTLRLAARKMTARYDAALEPVGLSVAQFALLRKIRRAGQPSLTEIGRLAGLDRSTVGRNVRVLEKAGLAALSRGKDQREATVRLPDKGEAALSAAEPLWIRTQGEIDDLLVPEGAAGLRRLAGTL